MNDGPILQVEDDENDVLLLRYVLRAAGIPNALVTVSDGQEAIAYLSGEGEYADRARHPLPCLVLLDLKMPIKNGFDVLRWVRAQPALRCLVIVVMTASADQQDIDRAYDLGANAFVIKPTGTDQLAELMKSLHGFWMRHNQFATGCSRAGR